VTLRLYRDDPYLLEFDARVVDRRDHQGRPAVVLDRTAFYAESGGQPWDTGTLDGVPVIAVLEHEAEILHVLGAPLPADGVRGRVDADRRRDHRQQHHGQHLLSRAFVEVAGAGTVSFHLGSDVSSIDLDREVGEAERFRAEARVNEIVWEGRAVQVRTVTRAEAMALGVTPPNEAGDAVRLVMAEGFDLQPCGGTHPRNTSEVGVVAIVGQERYKGGSRVRFLCGQRALSALRNANGILERLGALFSSPVERLPETAERLKDQLAAAERRGRDLLERALEGEARRLLAAASDRPAVIVATYEGWTVDELRLLAQSLVGLDPCVALLGSRGEKAALVFAQSDGLPHDIPGLLREAVARVGGRGGGKGNLAQGGGDDAAQLDAALAAAAARARSRPGLS
jgi:alanyl-tRNA synthetase